MSIIALDNGRSYVKFTDGVKTALFPSWVASARELKHYQYVDGDMIVRVGDKEYFVGGLAKREGEYIRRPFQDTKVVEEMKLHLYGVIYNMRDRLFKDRFPIVTGVPIENNTEKERTGIKQLLTGRHRFIVNGEPFDIEITNTYVTIEGGAIYYNAPADEVTRIIDAGAKTTNMATYDENRVYINRESTTIQKGWETQSIDDAAEYAQAIAAEGGRRDWQPTDRVLVAGGRAYDLLPHIQKHYPRAVVVDNPQFANVIGFHRAAMELVG